MAKLNFITSPTGNSAGGENTERKKLTYIESANPAPAAAPAVKTAEQIALEADRRNYAAEMQQKAHENSALRQLAEETVQQPEFTHRGGKIPEAEPEKESFWSRLFPSREEIAKANAAAAEYQAKQYTDDTITPIEAAAYGAGRLPTSAATGFGKLLSGLVNNDDVKEANKELKKLYKEAASYSSVYDVPEELNSRIAELESKKEKAKNGAEKGTDAANRLTDFYNQYYAEQQKAQQENPIAYGAGSLATNLAAMGGISAGLGAVETAAPEIGRAIGETGLRILNGAFTMSGVTALDRAGELATGKITAKEFAKDVSVSALGGSVSSAAGIIVDTGAAAFLTKHNLMTPFAEYVKNFVSAATGSTARIGTEYALADKTAPEEYVSAYIAQNPGSSRTDAQEAYKKAMQNQYVTSLLTTFLFDLVSSVQRSYQTMQKYSDVLTEQYQTSSAAAARFAARAANAQTPEDLTAILDEIDDYALQGLNSISGQYLPGQQEKVDYIRAMYSDILSLTDNLRAGMDGSVEPAYSYTPEQTDVSGDFRMLPAASPEAAAMEDTMAIAVSNGLEEAAGVNATAPVSQNTTAALMELAQQMQEEPAAAESPLPMPAERGNMTNDTTLQNVPAESEKTASTEETVVNDNPAEHTPEEQAVIEEYKSSASERLKAFIEKVRGLQNQDYKNKVRVVIDTSTSRAAEKAAELTGVDTSDYQNIINGSALQHIDNRHGENGSADKSMANIEDFSRIGFVLDNFTDAKIIPISSLDEETAKLTKAWRNSDNTPSPLVRFSMPINGTYYVVEAVPSSKARAMAVVSAYISGEKNNSGSINQVLNMDENTPPQLTPDAMLDPVASAGNSISQTTQESQAPASLTDTKSLEPIAETLGSSGQKAILNAYDGETQTDVYAKEFLNVYNAAKNGGKLPETNALTEAQIFAAESAGKNDALASTENKSPIEYLRTGLSVMNKVTQSGFVYQIYGVGTGYHAVIQRDSSLMNGMISDARSTIFDQRFKTREEAVDALVSVAENNRLTEPVEKESAKNENTVAEVPVREAVQQPAVSGEGTGGVLDGVPAEDVGAAGSGAEAPAVSAGGGRPSRGDGNGSDRGKRPVDRSGVGSGEGADLQPAAGGVSENKEPAHIAESKADGVPETAAAPISELPEQVQEEVKQKTADEVEPKGGNFVIPAEGLKLPAGEKARFKANIAAIKTLRTIMADQRMATPEEQTVLSKYVGWGGLANAFDGKKEDWSKEYKQLKGLLSESEWNAAMHSTLNAHYTEISVIRAMYNGLKGIGFTGGAVMEPSAGIGHFAGAMPEDLLTNIRSLTMVELDELTGNIAKALYPNADVRVQGFETAVIPDNYMDLAISNVPFGNYGITDKSYPKSVTNAIHNYFFAKSLDKVRPGGIVCFITSRFTMDARDSAVRSYIMERADLLGAIRLPDSAFKGNAGTEVVTDILVLKKREPGTPYSGEAFLNTDSYYRASGIWDQTNEYFDHHPEMVLGEASKSGSMYRGNSLTYTAKPGKLDKQIEKAFSKIKGRMEYPAKQTQGEMMKRVRAELKKADSKTKEGSYVKKDGKIYRNQGGELVEQEISGKQKEILTGGIEIRDTARELLNFQQSGGSAGQIDTYRKALNSQYDAFVKKYGPLHAPANKKILLEDTDGPFILSLENYNKETKTAAKADIFTKNTITPHQAVDRVDNVTDGLAVSINETGGVDLDMISRLLGSDTDSVQKMLIEQRLAFKTPDGDMQSAQQYLSGNVRAKLKAAEALATVDQDYKANVEELKKVIPADIAAQDISVRPGATWIPPAVYADFAAELLGGRNDSWSKAIDVTYIPATGQYKVEYGPRGRYLKGNSADISEYGTQDRSFVEIFEAALNSKDLKVYYPHGKDEKAVLNRNATIAVKEKKDKILSKFQEWMWSDKTRTETYAPLYNDTFNCMAVPNYDGSSLSINGLNAAIKLREHQANAVQRIIMSGGNVLLAHGTGAGKTLEMASACMKLRQIGAVKKPMIVVPKNLLGQWQREFYSYYPGAKILVPGENDFSVKNRKTFANKIATGDYDAVIITYEHFEKIPLSNAAQTAFYQQQVSDILAAEEAAKMEKGSKGFTVKQLAKKRTQLEAKIAELNSVARDETNIEFESLGVDSLFVDEAHNFKNLFYTTQMQGVSDLGNKEGSKRAYDLYMKVRYLQQLNGGRGVVFGTATPVMNSVVEMYTMQRYLQSDLLDQKGIGNFDAWVSEFGDVQEIQKMKAGGDGYEVKQSLSKYRNMAELQQMFRAFADVVTSPPGLADKLPKMRTGGPIVVECEPSEAQTEYLKEIGVRAEAVRSGNADLKKDNVLKIYSDGKKMSYTQRMIDTSLPYEDGGKVLTCVSNVLKEYKASSAGKGVQLVFCDRGVPGGQDEANGIFIYNDIKNLLVAGGIPESEIAFAQNYKSDAAKAEMQKKAIDGEIRVLIGSTQAMGTGLNIQKRAAAMHELNAPDRPGDIEQNRGRIIRQGNENKEVAIYTYITKKTFDSRQWDNLKRKGAFIHQAIAGDFTGRTADGDGDFVASAAEIAAIASDNPLIIEQNEVSTKIAKLEALELSHTKEIQLAKRKLAELPQVISQLESSIRSYEADTARRIDVSGDKFTAQIGGKTFTKRADAGAAIIREAKAFLAPGAELQKKDIGSFGGFDIVITNHGAAYVQGAATYEFSINFENPDGTVQSLANTQKYPENRLAQSRTGLEERKKELARYESLAAQPFDRADELAKLRSREAEIMEALNPSAEQGVDMGEGVELMADTPEVQYDNGGGLGSHPDRWTATRISSGNAEAQPKSITEIIEGIRHDFGFNITSGHVRGSGVRGQFNPQDKGIRSRIVNDLPTVSHELGHALDNRYGILKSGSLSAEMRTELENGLSQDKKDNYPKEKWLSEGLAEFVRKFLQNRETAAIDYPQFTDHFLKSLSGKDLALLEQLADDVNAYYSLTADTAAGSVRLREDGRPDYRTGGEKIRDMSDDMYQAWIDSNHGIKVAEEAMGGSGKAYILATNSAYSGNIAARIITGDLTDADGKYMGPGLKTALHGVNTRDKQEYLDFNEYLVVRHGPERLERGMRVFADDRKNSSAWMNSRREALEEKYPAFEAAGTRVIEFERQFTKIWGVGYGLIDGDVFDQWGEIYENHVPFQRVMERQTGRGAKRGYANQTSPYKRAKGSGRDIIAPVDNIIDEIVRVVNTAVRNNVMLELRKAALSAGADANFMEKIPTPMRPKTFDMTGIKEQLQDAVENSGVGAKAIFTIDSIIGNLDDVVTQYERRNPSGDVITIMVNGKPEYWKVNDTGLLQSVSNMAPAKLNGIVETYGAITRFMTANITGNNAVWSIFSNLPRDFATFLTYTKDKKSIFKTLGNVGATYLNAVKEQYGAGSVDPLFAEYLALGGGQASAYSADRDLAKKARNKLTSTKAQRVLDAANPINAVSFLTDTIEMGPRFATYRTLRNAGLDPQEAFYEAMDITVNFRKGGVKAREINKFFPFFNASLQGIDKFGRFFSADDQAKNGSKARKKAVRSRWGMFFAASVILAAINYALNQSDEEKGKDYQQLSNYTKNSYFVIPMGDGKYFAIPKPRELAVITSLLEAGTDYFVKDNEHAFDEFYGYAADQFLPSVLSDLAQLPANIANDGTSEGIKNTVADMLGDAGIVGVFANVSANRDFLGRPIESGYQQYYEPKDRWTESTSKIAYWMGQSFNMSPTMIDYIGNQVLGYLWKYQKALLPMDASRRDLSLGVKNSYVKDNEYSTDIVNWLYDKADASAMAAKSDSENMDKKIASVMDSRMTSFYSNFNKLNKANTSESSKRAARQKMLDRIAEYREASEADTDPAALRSIYKVVRSTKDTALLPSTLNITVKNSDGVEFKLNDTQYYEYQTYYLAQYYDYAERSLSGAKTTKEKAAVIKAAKDTAKAKATDRMLARVGRGTTGYFEKYAGVQDRDVIQFSAKVDIANDDGSLKQDEVKDIVLSMIENGLSYEDAYTLFHSRYDSDKNNPWAAYK